MKISNFKLIFILLMSVIPIFKTININCSDEGCDTTECCVAKTKKIPINLDNCYISVTDCPDPTCKSDTLQDDCNLCCSSPVKTAVHFRSQGSNTARELVGWQWHVLDAMLLQQLGTLYLAYEYQHSFKPDRLSNSLFASDTLKFSGSQVANRKANELLADNFGLSRTFQGEVSFSPYISNHIIDFGYYINLDTCCDNLYLRLHAPLVYTTWDLGACESEPRETSPEFEPCYMSKDSVPSAITLCQALSGQFLFGDMQTPWSAGRFNFNQMNKFGLADIDVILGYNWLIDPCYHLGFYAQLVLPTGNKKESLYVFDPVVGNGGHLEVGFGFSAHATLWSQCDHIIAVFSEGNLTHMFNRTQNRLFDFLKNGSFSRYLLLKEYTNTGSKPIYNGNLISATNFTNQKVEVKINAKCDLSFKLSYMHREFSLDAGYNFYGQSGEQIKNICDPCTDNKLYAIKGTEDVCCTEYPVVCVGNPDQELTLFPKGSQLPPGANKCDDGQCSEDPFTGPYIVRTIPDSTSEPKATAFASNPMTSDITNTCDILLASNSKQITEPTPVSDITDSNGYVVCPNITPIQFVSTSGLNIASGQALAVITHKVFTHLNYTWLCNGNIPYLGVGGEVEFDGSRRNDMTCKLSGLNQWGVWIKGGCSF